MGAKLTLGFSPCPNDCFIFDAMIHGKIDTEGLTFEVIMEDVESLNKKAFSKSTDITKLSYHAFAFLANEYQLLDSGSALGSGCGPLLITKHLTPSPLSFRREDGGEVKVAIPGKYTTANFLFSLAFPNMTNKVEMIFSEIEDAVLSGKADAGVIIHENRFTYEQKGLKKIIDLGECWENETGGPIPLGGIAMRRDHPDELKRKVNHIIRKSVEYAFANPKSSANFVREHAQEMSEDVRNRHIALYVNKFSINLGDEGRRAVKTLFNKAAEQGILKQTDQKIFL